MLDNVTDVRNQEGSWLRTVSKTARAQSGSSERERERDAFTMTKTLL